MRRLGESYREGKIVAKTFQELISKLEDNGYSCGRYYDMIRPESNWLYIQKDGDPYEYEAEITPGYRGGYELYFSDINRTGRRLDVDDFEESYRRKSFKKRRQMKENLYRVWYSPYDYPDEEDFMEVTANDEESAREFVRTNGYVTDVQEIDHKIDPYDECLEEANVVGMGGGWPNLYLPKDAKQYLLSNGFEKVNTELGPCFYMRFTGNEVWEIYVTEEDGSIYVVQEGYDIKPTDSLTLIDDRGYRDDIDALISLGNCLSNGEDFDSCIDAFFRGDLHTESISRRNKYFKEDLEDDTYHMAQRAVYDFFSKKQWDLNIPEVANYADGVAELLTYDPEFSSGEYTMRDWYKGTQLNYPEEIEWLDSTIY